MGRAEIKLAASPTSWGVDFADAPNNPPWQTVLDEIQRSGARALELGPVGYLPEDPDVLRGALTIRGLTAVGSFIFEDMHDPAAHEAVLSIATRACRAIRAAGGNVLVVIDRPSSARASTAGVAHLASRLPTHLWLRMTQLIERVAGIAREHELQPAFHPHAGSYVEFADEIEHLLADTEVGLCLDTGHAAYAGIAAHDAIRAYGSRIVHMHGKDVDPRVHDRVLADHIGFWDAISRGIFCPLGQGSVDFRRVASALDDIGYRRFLTIEQDRVPGTGEPVQELRSSVDVLRDVGIGAGDQHDAAPVETG